jgi:hypothetical protein
LHEFDRASADYGKAVQIDPQEAYSPHSSGLTPRTFGREEEATGGIVNAKAIEPNVAA